MDKNITLREMRDALGLTQEELAKALEMARPYISGIENGSYPFSKKLRKRIEDLYKSRNKSDKKSDTPKVPDAGFAEELEAIKRRLESIERLLIQLLAK